MANGKVFDIDMTIPGIFKPFDPIRRENEIKIERAMAKLHKDFAAFNLTRLIIAQIESQFSQRGDQSASVVHAAVDKQVGILRSIRKPEQDCARFPDE